MNRLLGDDRMIVDSTPGTTRDAIDSFVQWKDDAYIFIDTAGLRRKAATERVVRDTVYFERFVPWSVATLPSV